MRFFALREHGFLQVVRVSGDRDPNNKCRVCVAWRARKYCLMS